MREAPPEAPGGAGAAAPSAAAQSAPPQPAAAPAAAPDQPAPLAHPVVIIGPMGAGKTSVGKRVAKALGAPFVDTDRAIVRDHGPIPALFETIGEPRFRELERDAVTAALAQNAVVSLGGGAVLDESTRARLGSETVVLLTVTPEAVESRIGGSDRPLLHHDGLAAWKRIAAERAPVYAELADITFDTSHRPLSHVVGDIVAWIQKGTAE